MLKQDLKLIMNRVNAKILMLVIMIVMMMNWQYDSSEEVDEENVEIDDEMIVEVDENDINESMFSGEDDYYGKMALCGVVF